MGKKETIEFVHIPIVRRPNEVRDFNIVVGSNIRSDFSGREIRDPIVLSSVNVLFVSNFPVDTRLKNVSAPQKGAPNIRRISAQSRIHDVQVFEISGCEDLRDQAIRIYNHSTDLFCKDDLVELSEVPESQSAFDFTRKQSVPGFLMDLFVIRITTPPKIAVKLSISWLIVQGILK